MAGPNLPTNIDTTYADDPADPSRKTHQAHHDLLHLIANLMDTGNTAASGNVPVGNGSVLVTRALTAADVTVNTSAGLVGPNAQTALNDHEARITSLATGGGVAMTLDNVADTATRKAMTASERTFLNKWNQTATYAQDQFPVWDSVGGKFVPGSLPPTNPAVQVKTASYTLVAPDVGTEIEMNVAAANTVTVTTTFLAAAGAGGIVLVRQYGAGATTFLAGTGVTLRARGNAVGIAGQYGRAVLTARSGTECYIDGDIA